MTLTRFAVTQCGCMVSNISVPENYGFDTIICDFFYKGRPFPHPTFTGARGAHKWHHRYDYSLHRIQNSYQLFRKP